MRTVEKITLSINGQEEKSVLYVPTADPNCGEQAALQVQNSLKKLYEYEELEAEGLLVRIPCSKGTRLYRVTYPYRQEPKVTEYEVRNFRTLGKKQSIQLEVRVMGTNLTNWMYYDDFYKTREEAEEALRKEQKCEK